MSSRARVLPVLCLAAFLVVGCTEPPQKELEQAQIALDAAAAAGAAVYAPEEFSAAQTAMSDAKSAVDQRDYRLALNHALDSRERAQNAAKEAVTGKAAAKSVAERALSEADTALTNARATLEVAEERKVPARILSGPRSGIDTAAASLQEARAAFDQERYNDVPAKASAATALLVKPLAQLESASAPPPRRHR